MIVGLIAQLITTDGRNEMLHRQKKNNHSAQPACQSEQAVSLAKLVWPIFIEMILTMLVGNIDQYMVSSYSQNSVAAIGNANQILNLLLITFNIVSTSTTILVSQYIGSNNKHKVSITYTLSLFVNFIFSTFIMILILVSTDSIFTFMHVPEAILADAKSYMKIVGGFIFLQGIISAFSAIFRSNKMMKETMLISIAVNLINVLGNALLINGVGPFPVMGVAGAAWATNFSRLGGVILYIVFFIKKFETKISVRSLKPFPKLELKKLLGIGLPSGGENLCYSMAMTVILKIINTFGTFVINTKVYASTFAWFSFLYSSAVGQASQVIIGNYMGAGEVDLVDKRVKKTWRNALLIAIAMAVTMFLFSDFLFGIFTDDPRVLELGKKVMFIDIFLEMGKSTNITLVRSLQAAGDIKFPTVIGMISMWTIAVGCGYILGYVLNLGLVGIWIAMALDEDIRAIVFLIRWKKGKWRNIRLADD